MQFTSGHRYEFSSHAEIRQLQEQALALHLNYVASHSPYYRQLFKEHGVNVSSVTLDSLHTLPFTDKTILSEQNDSFLAVPMAQIVDIVLSSGTTGRSTKMMYTENDLQRLAYNEEISFDSCGLTKDDIVLLTCTIDRCFIAGLAYFSGIRRLGASAIRNGLCSFDSHLNMIMRFKPTVIVGVPTFLLKLGHYLKVEGIDPAITGIKKLICIGEPIRTHDLKLLSLGEKLESLWNTSIYSTYALSETISSFCECTAQQGGHLHPDLAVVEIIDDDGKLLSPGEIGEVVVTPLAIEGMPLVRFKTGDVSFLLEDPCPCGRNSVRLGPILGRKKQMIKMRGTAFYPNSINAVLDALPGVNDYYVKVSSSFDLSDTVKIFVSLSDGSCTAEYIMDKLQVHLRVRPEVVVISEEQVRNQLFSGNPRKLSRFVDERNRL